MTDFEFLTAALVSGVTFGAVIRFAVMALSAGRG